MWNKINLILPICPFPPSLPLSLLGAGALQLRPGFGLCSAARGHLCEPARDEGSPDLAGPHPAGPSAAAATHAGPPTHC